MKRETLKVETPPTGQVPMPYGHLANSHRLHLTSQPSINSYSSSYSRKPDAWIAFAFWAITIICLMNLNGILYVAFQVDRLASIAILIFGVVVIARTRNHWGNCLGPSGPWFFAFFACYLAIGSIVKFDPDQVISHLNSVFLIVVSALATKHFTTRQQTPRLVSTLSIVAVLGSYTVFLSPLLGGLYSNLKKLDRLAEVGRWLGFFANPNETGMAAVNALVVCLAVWSLPSGANKIKKVLPLIICGLALAVLLTFSRSAILAFGIIGTTYVLFTIRLDSRIVSTTLAISLGLTVSFWFFTSGYKHYDWTAEQSNRIQSIEKILTFEETTESDTGGRWNGVLAGIDYWQKRPITGHGLGTLHKMPYKYFKGLGCHNTHVMILGEVGLLGALPYLLAITIFLSTTLRTRVFAVKIYCLLFLLAFLLAGMTDHGILDTRSFNVLMGVAFGLQAAYSKNFLQAGS